jgi:hypothetical protein
VDAHLALPGTVGTQPNAEGCGPASGVQSWNMKPRFK